MRHSVCYVLQKNIHASYNVSHKFPLSFPPSVCFFFFVLTATGFGGWISSFVLLEGATLSEAKAAFLVSIFWAAVTIGRCVPLVRSPPRTDTRMTIPTLSPLHTHSAVAVGQAVIVGPSVSLRLQLFISFAGALTFLAVGAASFQGAAVSAAMFGYGMSSIYPLGMSWPGEAGFSMDTATTATLVIGGCVGEAVVPLVFGELTRIVCDAQSDERSVCNCEALSSPHRPCPTINTPQPSIHPGAAMHELGPAILPVAILSVVGVLVLALAAIEGLARAALSHRRQQDELGHDVEHEHSKVGAERQSRASTAAGGDEEEEEGKGCEKIGGSITLQRHARASFVTDKALAASAGTNHGYHRILSTAWGTLDCTTLARASIAAAKEVREGPPMGLTVSGASSYGEGGRGTVGMSYGTMSWR